MNAEQKAEHERQKLQARIDELEQRETRNAMSKEVRGMLSDADISISDALIDKLVSTRCRKY